MSVHREQWQCNSLFLGLRTSLDAFAIVVAIRDSRGRIADFSFLEVNDRACTILGQPMDRLLGAKLSDVVSAASAPA